MKNKEHYKGDLYFGVYLLPEERTTKGRYSISHNFSKIDDFVADLAARLERNNQALIGSFFTVNKDLYRMARAVVADLNTCGDSQFPIFNEERQITIDDIIQHKLTA